MSLIPQISRKLFIFKGFSIFSNAVSAFNDMIMHFFSGFSYCGLHWKICIYLTISSSQRWDPVDHSRWCQCSFSSLQVLYWVVSPTFSRNFSTTGFLILCGVWSLECQWHHKMNWAMFLLNIFLGRLALVFLWESCWILL